MSRHGWAVKRQKRNGCADKSKQIQKYNSSTYIRRVSLHNIIHGGRRTNHPRRPTAAVPAHHRIVLAAPLHRFFPLSSSSSSSSFSFSSLLLSSSILSCPLSSSFYLLSLQVICQFITRSYSSLLKCHRGGCWLPPASPHPRHAYI